MQVSRLVAAWWRATHGCGPAPEFDRLPLPSGYFLPLRRPYHGPPGAFTATRSGVDRRGEPDARRHLRHQLITTRAPTIPPLEWPGTGQRWTSVCGSHRAREYNLECSGFRSVREDVVCVHHLLELEMVGDEALRVDLMSRQQSAERRRGIGVD